MKEDWQMFHYSANPSKIHQEPSNLIKPRKKTFFLIEPRKIHWEPSNPVKPRKIHQETFFSNNTKEDSYIKNPLF